MSQTTFGTLLRHFWDIHRTNKRHKQDIFVAKMLFKEVQNPEI